MKGKWIAAMLVTCVLWQMTLGTLLLPKKAFSESENRKLAAFPSFTTNSYFSGEFTKGINTYFSDHFIGRDFWTQVKGEAEYLSGKRENNGVFICDNQLMARLTPPDEAAVGRSLSALSEFAAEQKNPQLYAMLVPSASAIQSDRLPPDAEDTLWSQKEAIDTWYASLQESGWKTVDAYGALNAVEGEEIYYRTDHHWTTLGAYYGYQSLGNALGVPITPLGEMEIKEVSDNFYGTLYTKAGYSQITPDTIFYYYPNGKENVKEVTITSTGGDSTYGSLYFPEYLETKDEYASFLGENKPYVSIKTEAQTGKKILLIKDSYANSLVPFLTSAYDEIDLVDLRYVNERFADHFDPASYDAIVMLYSVDTFSSSGDVPKIIW